MMGRASSSIASPLSEIASPDARAIDQVRSRADALAGYGRFIVILIQFALAVLVVRAFTIESPAFRRVLSLAAAGFFVHALLPRTMRRYFFVALCIGGMLAVFGMNRGDWNATAALLRSGALVAIGSGLIGICHLPLGYWLRAALLAALGAGLAVVWANRLAGPLLAPVWPVLAAMFMFRLIIYLYDLSTGKEKPTFVQSVSYFFLLPNVCFTLFPVVDFKTFNRTYYNEEELRIYQRGVRWMLRGIVHLVLYRLVDQLFALPVSSVENGTDVIQHVLANSFMYLRVSGQFHLIIGLLLMFGFNLPETNRNYFLAASFTDYWRRVNIYWKDFMLKVFYYPAYFRLKKLGTTPALILATLFSFFITWILHVYQTLWLKGSAHFTWPDTLFWLILGMLVVANSLWEMKKGRQRKLAGSGVDWRQVGGLLLRTAGTFAVISILWSLWSCPTLGQWIDLWKKADLWTLGLGAVALVCIMAATLVLEVLPASLENGGNTLQKGRLFSRLPGVLTCGVPLLLLLVISQPAIYTQLPPQIVPFVEILSQDGRSLDTTGTERGYYEQLMDVGEGDKELWEVYMHRPADTGAAGASLTLTTKDFRLRELAPGVNVIASGVPMQINSRGMRDREYALTKPPGTLRIALLGSSHVMGFGVRQEEMFETLLEERLNRQPPHGMEGTKFEVLNFAVNGYSPLAQLTVVDRARQFSPDIIIFVAHSVDSAWVLQHCYQAMREKVAIPYPDLVQKMADANVTGRTHEVLARSRLKPLEMSLLEWSYKKLVADIASTGAKPVCVFMALPQEPATPKRLSDLVRIASSSGFVMIDLTDVFSGHKTDELVLMRWNAHSSPKAHALVADALYERLCKEAKLDMQGMIKAALK